jgi:hypothetical protein
MNMSCADDEHVMRMFLGSRLLATARGVFLAHARRFFDSKTCRADQALRRFLGQNITHLR